MYGIQSEARFSQETAFHSFSLLYTFFFFFLVWFFSLKTESTNEGEGQRDNLEQAPHSAQSLMWGSIPQPWDQDLRRNQDSDAQLDEPPRRLPCFIHLLDGSMNPDLQ